jgi:hypothetical protein
MDAPIENDVDLMEEDTEEEDSAEEESEEEESEDETYIDTLIGEVFSEQKDKIAVYVDDPETPEELAMNDAIKRFLVQKVRNKLLDSFESQRKWIDDADLVAMVKKWKKLTAKEEIDASTAMKRIIKENAIITEAVDQHLEDMFEDAEEDDEEEDGD